jgi:hypothetical protein
MIGKLVVLTALIGAVLAAAASAASAPVVVPRLGFVTGKGGTDSVFLSNLDGTQRKRWEREMTRWSRRAGAPSRRRRSA